MDSPAEQPAPDIMARLPRIAHKGCVIGGREQDAESNFPVGRGGDITDHSRLENVDAKSIVADTREGSVDTYLKVVGHSRNPSRNP